MIKRGRKAQMQISFGMIFSIILIIVFLGFAFYAIKTFLGFQNEAKAAKMIDDLKAEVTETWESSVSSQKQEYLVPSSADFVCFVDFNSDAVGENSALFSELERTNTGNENFAFYPVEFTGFESAVIEHIDIEKTTAEENPLCIKASNGKVSFILKKDYGEALITIEKEQIQQ